MIDLEPAAREVARLLDGVSDGDLANPTPCPEFTVAALLDHIMGLATAFTLAARKAAPPEGFESRPGLGTAEHLDPAWRDVLPQRLDELAASWRDPGAWLGTAEAGGTSLPAEVMGIAALDELVLHGWDLARATDQKFTCDPASVQAVLQFTEASTRPEQADLRGGLFGPVVQVPDDASAFERALGYAGRDPRWSRASA